MVISIQKVAQMLRTPSFNFYHQDLRWQIVLEILENGGIIFLLSSCNSRIYKTDVSINFAK